MGDTATVDVRFAAAHALYTQYDRRVSRRDHPESLREELDHALTLVLSQGRAAESVPFLLRSVRRDARRILRRRNAARPEHTVFAPSDELIAGSARTATNWPGGVQFPDPEELLLASERVAQVNQVVRELGTDAAACLDGLRNGETVSECATRTGISPRRIRYLRVVIRARLAAGLRQDAA